MIKYFNKYLYYFFVFVAIRLILWAIFGTNLNPQYIVDGIEYKLNGTAFATIYNVPWHYTNVLQRTPLYMIFLYLIQGNLIWQILLCAIAGTLIFKANKWTGIYFLFSPNFIFQSFNYSKEALLVSLTLILIYFLWDKKGWLFMAIIILNLGFLGYSESLLAYNNAHRFPLMQVPWEMWKPSADVYLYATIGQLPAFFFAFPFWLIIPYYFRTCKLDMALIISIGITVFFALGWAQSRYQNVVLPLIVFSVFTNQTKPYLIKRICNVFS